MRIASRTSAIALTLSAMSALSLYGADTARLISSLSGNWKEDQSQRKIGSGAQLHFRTTASGGLEELRGPEARPMVQQVKLDGKSYDMESGNSMIWKQIDANNFERRTALNGKLLSVRRLRISNDGKTLIEEGERHSPDGRTMKSTVEFNRASGNEKGLVGKWQLLKVRDSEPFEMKYEAAGPNAVKVTGRLGQTQTLSLDGKPSAVTGPSVIPGMMMSATAIDDHTMETTTSREGVTAGKARIVLSDGGKVMTVTATPVGSESGREPSVTVYKKQ